VRDTAADVDLYAHAELRAKASAAFRFSPHDYEAPFNPALVYVPPRSKGRHPRRHSDMVSPQPMDRLVCGDVGFAKLAWF
jgi:transcription-repair coupling factor (superfamily II helicase)